MDHKIGPDLTLLLASLGTKQGADKRFAPPKTQDSADALCHEYWIADVMRKIGEDRKKIAKEMLTDLRKVDVDRLCADAVKLDTTQKGVIVQTANYSATLQAAKPVERLDKQQLFVELIKLGVDQVTIETAMDRAMKKNAPAQTLSVLPLYDKG